jgi:predicted ribosome quality control (RQC) complex YloA/Tae2 family protein
MANPKNLTPFPSVTKQPLAKKPLCVKVEVEIDEFVRSLSNPSGWLRYIITKAVKEYDGVPNCEECNRFRRFYQGRQIIFQQCDNQNQRIKQQLKKAQERIKELEQKLAK